MAVEDRARRVGDRLVHVVALDEHGVEAGDRAPLGGAGALEQARQRREHRRRVAARRRRLADREPDLAAGHREAGDRVDHQQHVPAGVAERLGDRGRDERGLDPDEGRLVGGRDDDDRAAEPEPEVALDELAHLAAALADEADHVDVGRRGARDHPEQRRLADARSRRRCRAAGRARRGRACRARGRRAAAASSIRVRRSESGGSAAAGRRTVERSGRPAVDRAAEAVEDAAEQLLADRRGRTTPPVATTRLPGAIPSISPSGISSVRPSRKPTTSAGTGSVRRPRSIRQRSPTAARRPRPRSRARSRSAPGRSCGRGRRPRARGTGRRAAGRSSSESAPRSSSAGPLELRLEPRVDLALARADDAAAAADAPLAGDGDRLRPAADGSSDAELGLEQCDVGRVHLEHDLVGVDEVAERALDDREQPLGSSSSAVARIFSASTTPSSTARASATAITSSRAAPERRGRRLERGPQRLELGLGERPPGGEALVVAAPLGLGDRIGLVRLVRPRLVDPPAVELGQGKGVGAPSDDLVVVVLGGGAAAGDEDLAGLLEARARRRRSSTAPPRPPCGAAAA